MADWINGWDTKNYGRVWKMDVTADKNDMSALRTETKRLMQLTYPDQTVDVLYNLLSNPDMRIRQKAQFELVDRGAAGAAQLNKAIAQTENQLARIHGIWGLGQLARQDKTYGKPLVALLTDKDPEIVAQSAKVIGDEMLAEAGPTLVPLLASQHPRVKFFSAQALGRIHDKAAVEPLLAMIKANNDEDVYLRHAAVLALSRIGQVDPIAALAKSSDKSLRLAGVLVLRRLKSDKVALFLKDSDEYIVTEAARAINDDESIPTALPALAGTLGEKRFTAEPLLRRAINACLRVGGNDQVNQLLAFAKRTDVDKALRAEALATLGTWAAPSVLDRVDGRYRGMLQHDLATVQTAVQPYINDLLQDSEPAILVATAQMVSNLGITSATDKLAKIQQESGSGEVRGAVLTALNTLHYAGMESALKMGMSDSNVDVRTVALGLMRGQNLSAAALAEMSKTIFEKGTEKEQQQLIQVLGAMPVAKTEPILSGLIDRMAAKTLAPSLALELNEAVDSTKSAPLIAKLAPFRSTGMTVADYQDALFGGDRQAGRRYFMTNSTGQCVRCHAIGGQGGEVGPSLTNIGNVLTRDQLLQALIEPSARLSPGYGTVMLTLADGQTVSGVLMQESDSELVLKTTEAEPLKVAVSRIKKRENMPSSMPPMGYLLSKREIRDVVEFLTNLKGGR
ncbi:MAG: c-type cytochrome [Cytophagaceae bacterium]|nr:MAG: c-type cytochrome [Cytophagaceae bacterium]